MKQKRILIPITSAQGEGIICISAVVFFAYQLCQRGSSKAAVRLCMQCCAAILLQHVIDHPDDYAKQFEDKRKRLGSQGYLIGVTTTSILYLSIWIHEQESLRSSILLQFSQVSLSFEALTYSYRIETPWSMKLLITLSAILSFENANLGFYSWISIVQIVFAIFSVYLSLKMLQMEQSFSIGEAFTLSQGIVGFFANLTCSMLMDNKDSVTESIYMDAIYQSCILLSLLFFLNLVFKDELAVVIATNVVRTVAWYLFELGCIFFWLASLLDLRVLAQQLLSLVFDRQSLFVLAYWFALVGIFLPVFSWLSKFSIFPNIVVRKLFHILICGIFIPGCILNFHLLRLASSGVFLVAILVEVIRAQRHTSISKVINAYLKAFTDARDMGMIIMSHLSLLLGVSFPIWYLSPEQKSSITMYSGLLVLGVADVAGVIVGRKFGQWKMCLDSKKTLEGTLAAAMLTIGGGLLINSVVVGTFFTTSLLYFCVLCLQMSLLESFTLQLDNIFVPVFFFSMLLANA